jgi:hypothetical protein
MGRLSEVEATGSGCYGTAMRASLLLGLSWLAVSSLPATASAEDAPAASGLRILIEYRPPKDPAHQVIYDELKKRQVLEKFAEIYSVLVLPRPLTLAFAPCDGVSNAWYDAETTAVTFCYEYVAEIRQLGMSKERPKGLPLADAVDGPVAFVMLHETGHAVFNLLKVPILGKEEDAADAFAAVVLLRMGHDVALRMLRGTAWQYAHIAKQVKLDESWFSDVHALDAQRYYNVMCLAYGSDPKFFGPLVEKYLPKDRAEGCPEEFQQAAYAVKTLIAPSIDAKAVERVKEKHGKKWETGK